jgi:phytoene synthase
MSSWENRLIALAHEGLDSIHVEEPFTPNAQQLQVAYQRCEEITSESSRTFYLASRLLPSKKRQAARALYAFCRVTDDLVDRQDKSAQEKLDAWKNATLCARPDLDDLVALAWADTRQNFQIPCRYIEQFFDGVGQDIYQSRYHSFEELSAYCYGVAATVGLMVMHIIGFEGPHAIPYALKLGVALQMTNILRDVAEDWRKGRVYLPLDEMKQFGLSEEDIAAGTPDARWHKFMNFQIERTRQLYASAAPGIQLLYKDGRFAIGAASELYAAILEDIQAHEGDVFSRRAHVSGWGKLRRLPGIWWRYH